MKLLCCLLLLAALATPERVFGLAPTDPHLTARWTRPGQAVVSWTQPAGTRLTCLARGDVLLRCWQGLAAGRMALTLGGAGTDAAYRPAAHDVYRLLLDGVETRAGLRGEVRLAVVRR